MKRAFFAILVGFAANATFFGAAHGQNIDIGSELFISDVSVVDDPRAANGGAWSFGELIRQMSGTNDPNDFLEAWIDGLTNSQLVNGDTHQNLASSKDGPFNTFFAKWLLRSGGITYDLDKAPFRLLAIVNRPDLLKISSGVPSSAGEGRFLFTAVQPLDPDPETAPASAGNFFVIFEYGIPANSLQELKNWHSDWHDLSNNPIGSPAYLAALETITNQFTHPDPFSGRVNGSYLNQLRTNEFNLPGGSSFWDLREFTLQANPGFPNLGVLQTDTTKQTPNLSYNTVGSKRVKLKQWLNQNGPDVLAGSHTIGLQLDGVPFLGSLAVNDTAAGTLPPDGLFGENISQSIGGTPWWAPTYANNSANNFVVTREKADIRHKFALQTCSGCHHLETNNHTTTHPAFVMVSKRQYGSESSLAGFLVGTGEFVDPVNPYARIGNTSNLERVNREFNDLEARRSILSRILNLDLGPGGNAVQKVEEIQQGIGTRVH